MSLYVPPTYLYSINDVPGVALANNFLSLFNPSGSGKVLSGLQLIVSTYSGSLTASPNSLLAKRITSATVGTLIAASTIARFRTASPDPVAQVRIANPTVGGVGLAHSASAPVISTGAGQSSSAIQPPPGASFLYAPGEGAVITTASGDLDQVWNISILWSEAKA